jgi:hypothetical protein
MQGANAELHPSATGMQAADVRLHGGPHRVAGCILRIREPHTTVCNPQTAVCAAHPASAPAATRGLRRATARLQGFNRRCPGCRHRVDELHPAICALQPAVCGPQPAVSWLQLAVCGMQIASCAAHVAVSGERTSNARLHRRRVRIGSFERVCRTARTSSFPPTARATSSTQSRERSSSVPAPRWSERCGTAC